MSFKVSKWFNNYQAASVLMIDDLNDAYIEQYKERYKNDWGYYCDDDGSLFFFVKKNLLNDFPYIKITYFVPYLRHNSINENMTFNYRKYAVGERKEFSKFLKQIVQMGHEIAHHGSTHGVYINPKNLSSANNFKHEWELYQNIDDGVRTTLNGVEVFNRLGISITGGKFCGYKMISNSLAIIDRCNFEYWCVSAFDEKHYSADSYGKNNIIDFPTTFSGNSFVRLSYHTGNREKDRIKNITKIIQPFYNILQYRKLDKLYKDGRIISIQEHSSPSKSSGEVQSANIISDIKSLRKIYEFLSNKSVWYATCHEISRYIYLRENIDIEEDNGMLLIKVNNYKGFKDLVVSLVSDKLLPFSLLSAM